MYFLIKSVLTAIFIILVTEVAKRNILIAAVFISIPLSSIIAILWLYIDLRETDKIIVFSYKTLVMIVPSLTFFISLPILLNYNFIFYLSFIFSIIATTFCYSFFIYIIKKYDFML